MGKEIERLQTQRVECRLKFIFYRALTRIERQRRLEARRAPRSLERRLEVFARVEGALLRLRSVEVGRNRRTALHDGQNLLGRAEARRHRAGRRRRRVAAAAELFERRAWMLAVVQLRLRREAWIEDDLGVRLKHDDGGACWCGDGAHQVDGHDGDERECEQKRAHVERRRRQWLLRASIGASGA